MLIEEVIPSTSTPFMELITEFIKVNSIKTISSWYNCNLGFKVAL